MRDNLLTSPFLSNPGLYWIMTLSRIKVCHNHAGHTVNWCLVKWDHCWEEQDFKMVKTHQNTRQSLKTKVEAVNTLVLCKCLPSAMTLMAAVHDVCTNYWEELNTYTNYSFQMYFLYKRIYFFLLHNRYIMNNLMFVVVMWKKFYFEWK